MAGVQAGSQGGELHRARDHVRGQAGDLVPRAGTGNPDPDDEHVHVRGEEDDALRGGHPPGLQVRQVQGVFRGAGLQLQACPRPRSHPGVVAQEEMSPPRQCSR